MVLVELFAFPVPTVSMLILCSRREREGFSLCSCLVEISVKRSRTSCSCGDPEVNCLLPGFSEILPVWAGGGFCLVFEKSPSVQVSICSAYQLFCS